MSDNKKYYYLKLKDNFFDSEEMKILESQKNGIEYQTLYLKLCLLSLKSDGKLIFKDYIPYDINMLSTVLRVGIDTVKTGIELLNKLKLIEITHSGIMYMTDIQSLIGKGSSEGDRIKSYRKRIKNESKNTAKRTLGVQMYSNRTPELELELELEKELEKEKDNIDRFFCDWWELYDKKVGKQKAIKEFIKLHPNNELFNLIMNHTKKYCETRDKEFRKDPDGYIKNKCWNDEIIEKTKKQKQNPEDLQKAYKLLDKLGASKNV